MKVLFIGGTGTISASCTQLAAARGLELVLLNRGSSDASVPPGVEVLHADIRDERSVEQVLGDRTFDVVVDWVAFGPEHVAADMARFRGRTGQFVFISSASAYQTPPVHLPVTEETPLENPYWAYSQAKIACETALMRAHADEGFPVTIVRPSHTYNEKRLPFQNRYTEVDRMRRGKPVIVPGDGSSLWTLTHADDFAVGFLGLMGRPEAIGEAFHITSDEALPWNQVYQLIGRAAGVEPELVHMTSACIHAADPTWGVALLGDKGASMVFDNSKIKALVPEFDARISYAEGARLIMAWHDADPARRQADPERDALCDRLVAAQQDLLRRMAGVATE